MDPEIKNVDLNSSLKTTITTTGTAAEISPAMDTDDLYDESSPTNPTNLNPESQPIPATTSPSSTQPSTGIPGLFLLSDPSTEAIVDTEMGNFAGEVTGTKEQSEHAGFSRDDFKFAVGGEELVIATETQFNDQKSDTLVPANDSTIDILTLPGPTPQSETLTDTPEKLCPKSDHSDTDFLATGLTNKALTTAEWELDSSASDSDSDSDSNSEADSEEYDLLDPQSLAKLLMDEGDSDTERRNPLQEPLKTKNEIPDEALPIQRPQITITPSMVIEELGTIQSIIGTMALVKASTSGDHKVLNESSLLCFDDRMALGVVADTFGRVEEPLYTVRFNTPEEITETGAVVGRKVYYVPQHSEYVFTAALKAVKGSDASNIFDEEVGEAEREFSDDEKEAEAKRVKKVARQVDKKKDRRGGMGMQVVKETDEPYVPLTRPANLQEMLAAPPPPLNNVKGRDHKGRNDRGGRGRGRGGQRGRGRDNRDHRGGEFRNEPPPQDRNYNQQPYQSQPQQFSPQYSPQQQWIPPPSLSQFQGYPQQQYSQYPQQQQQQQQQQNFFTRTLPQGAHVNPAFFRAQQSEGFNWTQSVQPQQPPQQPQVDADAFRALQNLLNLSKAAQGQGQQGRQGQ